MTENPQSLKSTDEKLSEKRPRHGKTRGRKIAGERGALTNILLFIVAFLLASTIVLGAVIGIIKFVCFSTLPVQAGELITARTIFVVFDQTGSMGEFAARAKSLVKNHVIDQIGPGDYVECYQIDGAIRKYNEVANRVFGGDEKLPPVRENIIKGAVSSKDFDDECKKGPEFKDELKSQWNSLREIQEKWAASVDSKKRPDDNCCSAYLDALDYIAQRLNPRGGQDDLKQIKGEKWLIVIGDLYEEPRLSTAVMESERGRQEILSLKQDNSGNRIFRDVKVLLIRPSGSQERSLRTQLDDFWEGYFVNRGAAQVKFLWFNDPPGMIKSKAPRVD